MEKTNTKKTSKYKKIILYGFMCSGKTTVAKSISKKLGLKFYDIDTEFEKIHGRISDFTKRYGFTNFRKIEKKIFSKILKEENCVIATGGGFFPTKKPQALEIFLNPPFEILEKRFLKNKNTRPLLTGYPETKKKIITLYKKRLKKYSKALITIKEIKLREITNKIKAAYYGN
ncbi:MAG: shikimate kinase [Elusimicrobiota bacterium]